MDVIDDPPTGLWQGGITRTNSSSSTATSEYTTYSKGSNYHSPGSSSVTSSIRSSSSCGSFTGGSSCSSVNTVNNVTAGSTRSWASKLWGKARSLGSLTSDSSSDADMVISAGNVSPLSSPKQAAHGHGYAAAAAPEQEGAQEFGQHLSCQHHHQQQQDQGREQFVVQTQHCWPQTGTQPGPPSAAVALQAQQSALQPLLQQVCPQPQTVLQGQQLYQQNFVPQQMYQHIQLSTVQQLHLVPVMLPAQLGTSTAVSTPPAAAAAAVVGSTGCFLPMLQPHPGFCSVPHLDPNSYGQLYQQPGPGLNSACFGAAVQYPEGCARVHAIPAQSIFQQVWSAVATVMQQQQQQQFYATTGTVPAEGATTTAPVSSAQPSVPWVAGFALQQWCTIAHALAALLMYMLLCTVAAMLAVRNRLAAAVARVAATKDALVAFAQQQRRLFIAAAEGTAAATDVEQLRQLLGRSNNSSAYNAAALGSIGCIEASSSFVMLQSHVAEVEGNARSSSQQQPGGIVSAPTRSSSSEQQLSTAATAAAGTVPCSISSSGSLIVVLGLWAGVLMWVSRWLLLQVPAATSQAVSATCQHTLSAAEEAGTLVLEYTVRVVYGLSLAVVHQVRSVAVRLLQVGCMQGYTLAQHAVCFGLWALDILRADSAKQQSVARKLIVQVVQAAAAVTGRVGQQGLAAAEVVAAAVTAKLLRDASPVTQTAVWGLAGLLKRNLVESCNLCWQLLLQLSLVYTMQQQQQQQPQSQAEGKSQ